jgi:hypothetical protein
MNKFDHTHPTLPQLLYRSHFCLNGDYQNGNRNSRYLIIYERDRMDHPGHKHFQKKYPNASKEWVGSMCFQRRVDIKIRIRENKEDIIFMKQPFRNL